MSNFDLNISVLTPGPGTADGCLDFDVTLSVVRGVRGGEGGNRTSHHLIPIQQHNIFKTRPAFAIVKPLVGEVNKLNRLVIGVISVLHLVGGLRRLTSARPKRKKKKVGGRLTIIICELYGH